MLKRIFRSLISKKKKKTNEGDESDKHISMYMNVIQKAKRIGKIIEEHTRGH